MQVNGKPEKIENAKQTVSSKDDTDIPADELFAEFSDIEPDDDETL
jgi:hypothetical protein